MEIRCVACNSSNSDILLEGDLLEMFNFVCCLEINEPDETQSLCKKCNEELKISFNFKKRCLEIFANIFDNSNETDFDGCLEVEMESLLDMKLHEDENSLNLTDLPGTASMMNVSDNSELSILEVSDLKCRYCFIDFPTKEDCSAHLEDHKGQDKPYQCPHDGCNSTFKARKNLKDHYLVHSTIRPFTCHFCPQSFKSSSNRSKHERRIHSKERSELQKSTIIETVVVKSEPSAIVQSVKIKKLPPVINHFIDPSPVTDIEQRIYKCEHEGCLSSFKTRGSLRDHQKVHSDARDYPCGFCSSAFKSSSNRSKHERGIHQDEYQKRKIDREFTRNNGEPVENGEAVIKKTRSEPVTNTVKHQEPSPSSKKQTSNKKPKEFPCRYCYKVFHRADNREKHESTHKDSAFDCGRCFAKSFKTREELRVHMKIHTEPSELKCSQPGCDQVYQNRRSLKEHESSHINADSEYSCEEEGCKKVFSSYKALNNHRKVKHLDSVKFKQETNTEEHISCDI